VLERLRARALREQRKHKAYIARHGDDMPDITSWRWGARAASSAGASSTEADNV
jgi:xylulose-5-phosphate/fructose-6-phosphate phosphoketolase